MKILLACTIAAGLLFSQQAFADDICTDRPGKSSGTCVVPEGHFQLETDLYNWTNNGPVLFTSPVVKYGLGHNLDIELGITPYERVGHSYGSGDLYIKLKYEFLNEKIVKAALFPYIKIPIAPAPQIGNGRVEGGLLVPVQFSLPLDFSLTFVPEIDQFQNPNGYGYYTNFQGVINLQHTIFTDRVIGAVELWQQIPIIQNSGRRIPQQQSIDISVQWLVTPSFQVDGGINFGTNSATPRQQIYVGISQFF